MLNTKDMNVQELIGLSDYPILNGNFSYVVNIELYIWPTANYKCIGLCKQAQ
jgi:hypothetical protein